MGSCISCKQVCVSDETITVYFYKNEIDPILDTHRKEFNIKPDFVVHKLGVLTNREQFSAILKERFKFELDEGSYFQIRCIAKDGYITPFEIFKEHNNLKDFITNGGYLIEIEDPR